MNCVCMKETEKCKNENRRSLDQKKKFKNEKKLISFLVGFDQCPI